jgi:glucose-fructose oxidoreductase
LRFPGDRLAAFTCSFGAATADAYQVVGTKGTMWLEPAFDYHPKYEIRLKIEGKEWSSSIHKVDQFGGEIEYFSECVLNDKEPEPSGYEGMADIRVVEALLQSIRSGAPVKLEPYEKPTRPSSSQEKDKSAIKPQKLIHAQSASGGN